MSQVLEEDKSLSNAVSRVIAWLSSAGEVVPDSDTGAESIARKRLPLTVFNPLFKLTVEALLFRGEAGATMVRTTGEGICVGTTVLMSDTPANQKHYPQHSNSVGRMWVSTGKIGGVVLCDHGSRFGSIDGSIYYQ